MSLEFVVVVAQVVVHMLLLSHLTRLPLTHRLFLLSASLGPEAIRTP